MHLMSAVMISDALSGVCETLYFSGNLRINSPITKKQYRHAPNDFAAFLGRIPIIDDLRKPVLTGFLRWLKDVRGLAAKTCNERTGRLRALWQWLAEEQMLDRIPPRNLRLPEPETVPVAWSTEELRAIFYAAGNLAGQVSGVPAGKWWQALLLWLWNTGARYGETMALEWEMIRGEMAVIPGAKRKGGLKTAYYRLWPDTLERMHALRGESSRVFAWDRSECSYYLEWNRLLKSAGLPTGRKRKTQSMRVSHATWLAASGGDATRSLMHSSGTTTAKHYLDRAKLAAPVELFRLGE